MMFLGQTAQRAHIGHLPVEVNRDDRAGTGSDLRLNVFGIHVERDRVDIGEDGGRAQAGHATGGRKKGERGDDHFVARPDFCRHQREEKRIASGGTADPALGLPVRERTFHFR